MLWFDCSFIFCNLRSIWNLILIVDLSNYVPAYWDVEKGEVILCDSVDISIAVATEKVLCRTISPPPFFFLSFYFSRLSKQLGLIILTHRAWWLQLWGMQIRNPFLRFLPRYKSRNVYYFDISFMAPLLNQNTILCSFGSALV